MHAPWAIICCPLVNLEPNSQHMDTRWNLTSNISVPPLVCPPGPPASPAWDVLIYKQHSGEEVWPSPASQGFKRTLLLFWEMHTNRASPSPWNDLFIRDYFGVCKQYVCHALTEHRTVLAVCSPTLWHFNLSTVGAGQCHSFLTWGHVETHLFWLTVLESYAVLH